MRIKGESFLFAVQLGPTYGGHFRVCPEARLDDGLFDICLAHPPLGFRARDGRVPHGEERPSHGLQANRVFTALSRSEVTFDREPPAQMDGERLLGSTFSISTVPAAMRVIGA